MNADFHMENLVMIAENIATKYGISMDDAMGLAEFNLQSASVKEVLARI